MGTYLVVFAPSDPLRETAFLAISGLAASVLCGYLGFAAYDDRNFMQHLRDSRIPKEEEP
jgi:hypothetical protein